MQFAKITGAGLSSIALLVTVLWGCIVGEHLILRNANRDFSQAMAQIHELQSKRRMEPAAAPKSRHLIRPSIS